MWHQSTAIGGLACGNPGEDALLAMPCALILSDPRSGAILRANERAAELFGVAVAELCRRREADLYVDARARLSQPPRLPPQQARPQREVELRRADGCRIRALSSVDLVQLGGRRALATAFMPLPPRDEAPGAGRTDGDQTAPPGRETARLAHELSNLLQIIVAHASFLAETTSTDAPRQEVDEILRATQRAGSVLRLMMGRSREGADRGPVDLATELPAQRAWLARLLGPGVETQIRVVDAPLRVPVGEVTLQRVLRNLALNARAAMPMGGRFTVQALRAHAQDFTPGGPDAAEQALLVVIDTGAGMDADTLRRALEPGFTTRGGGGGHGIGLDTCRRDVERCGGDLTLWSWPGRGTRVEIALPLARDPEPGPDSTSRRG